jgi:D-lactate dehydrogenase (cytochrome)
MVMFIRQEVSGLLAYVFGHAGDGNIHVIVMDNPSDGRRWTKVEKANQRIVEKALAFEGTCTGAHGVGIGKRCFLPAEHGDSLELMKRIKQLIDPEGLFNPGKLFL